MQYTGGEGFLAEGNLSFRRVLIDVVTVLWDQYVLSLKAVVTADIHKIKNGADAFNLRSVCCVIEILGRRLGSDNTKVKTSL